MHPIIRKQLHKKKLDLPTYEVPSLFRRFIIFSILGVGVMRFMAYLKVTTGSFVEIGIKDYLLVVVVFNCLNELLIFQDRMLERWFPIPEKISLRVFLQLLLSVLSITVFYRISYQVMPGYQEEATETFYYLGVAIGLIFASLLSTALIMIRLMTKWVNVQKLIDDMKREKLQMDYNQLQDQLNPHFLFNNLSILKSLILYDKEAAVTFTDNFTDVYRYVLHSQQQTLVYLRTELEFIDSYIALHQERLGAGMQVNFLVSKLSFDKLIAPMSLQLLIENCLKHNIASTSKPLFIEVYTEGNSITVKNAIQRKESSYSTNTGLDNLIQRYSYLSKEEVQVEQTPEYFKVTLPLLDPDSAL